MEKFFLPRKRNTPPSEPPKQQKIDGNIGHSSEKRVRIETDDDIISDPSLRKDINEYEDGNIIRLLSMWSSVGEVLVNIYEDGTERKNRSKVVGLIDKMENYEFVFIAHLMKILLGLTNSLSQFLQQKDQNIVEAMSLVSNVKRRLQTLRDNGWDDLLEELLMCISCLDPKNSFSNFSATRVLRLAELYPEDFSLSDRMELKEELKTWLFEMRENQTFSKLQNIGDLAKKMVEVKIHTIFPLVYLLIQLALVLPVATATVERVFSAMNIIKSDLRNKMGDNFLTDCLVCYVEKDVFMSIENEVIIQHFQNMTTRRLDLPPLRVEG